MEKMVEVFNKLDEHFWMGKKVFLTGHTGFKGSWLSFWLNSLGAKVFGYALPPSTHPNIFDILKLDLKLACSTIADIRSLPNLKQAIVNAQPDLIIHMAAQSLVRASYEDPVNTYETNIMGTVNLLEAARGVESIKAILVVSSDKCYENFEWCWGYRESDRMGGQDPYSSSKGCVELVVAAYQQSFFSNKNSFSMTLSLASARAGNVIGGGDWSENRLIPDAIKAYEKNRKLIIRNPSSIRPWQHVLEPLSGYLTLAQKLFLSGGKYCSGWNFGPKNTDICSVKEIIQIFSEKCSFDFQYCIATEQELNMPAEANFLSLDCSKSKWELDWESKWPISTAIQKVVEWHDSYAQGMDMCEITKKQIEEYISIK